jgi:hypothetical protein
VRWRAGPAAKGRRTTTPLQAQPATIRTAIISTVLAEKSAPLLARHWGFLVSLFLTKKSSTIVRCSPKAATLLPQAAARTPLRRKNHYCSRGARPLGTKPPNRTLSFQRRLIAKLNYLRKEAAMRRKNNRCLIGAWVTVIIAAGCAGCGGGSSSQPPPPPNPIPTVTTLSPNSSSAGGPALKNGQKEQDSVSRFRPKSSLLDGMDGNPKMLRWKQ